MKRLFVFGLIMLPFVVLAQSKTKKVIIKPDTTVYTKVDEIPEFAGGLEKLGVYLAKTQIPPLDTTESIHGRIVIQMIVEKDGSLTHLKVVRSANRITDQAYIERLRQSLKWKPGLIRGKPVRVMYSIPISICFASDE
jgi:protein TonB